MPIIRSSADLRNHYSEISRICHETRQPVFITKNGQGDLAVMTVEEYDYLLWKLELHPKLTEGLVQSVRGEGMPADEFFAKLREELADEAV